MRVYKYRYIYVIYRKIYYDNSKHGYHVKNKLVALQFVNKFLFSFYDSFVSC